MMKRLLVGTLLLYVAGTTLWQTPRLGRTLWSETTSPTSCQREAPDRNRTSDHDNDNNKNNNTSASLLHVFDYLCEKNVTRNCCRYVTDMEVLDELSLRLSSALTRKQSQPGLTYTDPYGTLRPASTPEWRNEDINCANISAFQTRTDQKVFTGKPLPHPRTIVDVFLVNNELDPLEARLYELDAVVDYFVIVESSFNMRGIRKPKFLQEVVEKRFPQFRDKLFLVDVDRCDAYIREIQNVRRDDGRIGSAGADVWTVQGKMRSCIWSLVKDRIDGLLPEDALVNFSDLDEVPSRTIVKHIRHCEPSRGLDQPFYIVMSHLVIHNPRMGCTRTGEKRSGWISWMTPISQVRSENDIVFRKDKQRFRSTPMLYGGFHMQAFGSLADYMYREFSHSEGGGLALGPRFQIDDWCSVTNEHLEKLQRWFSRDPTYLFWRFASQNPDHVLQAENAPPAPSKELVNELKNCYFPWIMIENPQRYPFQWGYGEYDMYSS